MTCLQLFISFLKIGCFSFGGGYAAMPLIQDQVVTLHGWLNMDSFTNLVAIAEMTPGPIAVNAATFVGTQTAGLPGAIAATAGCILPSCIFVTFLAWVYAKYRNLSLLQGTLASLRPAVIAMIAKAGISILAAAFIIESVPGSWWNRVDIFMVMYFAVALILLRKIKMNPLLVMALCGIAEVIKVMIKG